MYNIICDTLNLKPIINNGLSAERSLVPFACGWADGAEYPGVTFKTEVLPINSTDDELFRSKVVDNGIETSTRLVFSVPSTAATMPTRIPSTGEANNVDDTDDTENDGGSGHSNKDDGGDLASKISDLFDDLRMESPVSMMDLRAGLMLSCMKLRMMMVTTNEWYIDYKSSNQLWKPEHLADLSVLQFFLRRLSQFPRNASQSSMKGFLCFVFDSKKFC